MELENNDQFDLKTKTNEFFIVRKIHTMYKQSKYRLEIQQSVVGNIFFVMCLLYCFNTDLLNVNINFVATKIIIQTYSSFIPEGVAEVSQVFLRDTHDTQCY
jgi:hypothetical protein